MRVKRKHVGMIFKKIWNSNLNIKFGWAKDGDIKYITEGNLVKNTGQQSMEVGVQKMCESLVIENPDSEFAYWYIKTFNFKPLQK